MEVPQLGLTGFNAATDRTGFGLGGELPAVPHQQHVPDPGQFLGVEGRALNEVRGGPAAAPDQELFHPGTRGRLTYDTLQTLVDDVASVANINKPLPGGDIIVYYKWDDYYFFAQDSWKIRPSFTLNYGLRYELPGNSFESLYKLNDRVLAGTGNQPVFILTPRPGSRHEQLPAARGLRVESACRLGRARMAGGRQQAGGARRVCARQRLRVHQHQPEHCERVSVYPGGKCEQPFERVDPRCLNCSRT